MNLTRAQFSVTSFLVLFLILSPVNAQNGIQVPPDRPKLVVQIMVSNMGYDDLMRYWNKFGAGGFRSMIQNGTLCSKAGYNYIFTESSVSNASISAGTYPSQHGIIGNSWYVDLNRQISFCVDDPSVSSVGGSYENGKKSPSLLLATTYADELRLSGFFKPKVIGISLDPRAAILSTGHTANAAYWYDDERGSWMSSSYYLDRLPDWVQRFNEKKLADTYLSRSWEPLLPLDAYSESFPDSSVWEQGIRGRGVFPYDLERLSRKTRRKKDYSILKITPFGNTYTKDMAIAAIAGEELGRDEYPDVLSVGFSATGYIGDHFGPGSVEMVDALMRLDRDLEHFLDYLHQEIGRENILVVLSSDHGLAYPIETLQNFRIPTGEFNVNAALSLLESYLGAIYGKGDWVRYYHANQVYLNRELILNADITLQEIRQKVAEFLVQFEGISMAVTASVLQSTNFTGGIRAKMQNAYHQKRSGDVIIQFAPGWSEKNRDLDRKKTAYAAENHVPLIWYGWRVKRSTLYRPVDMVDVAPTICTFLDIPYPNACLGEAILELVSGR